MAENNKKTEEEDRLTTDQATTVKSLLKLQKDTRIILYMPEDLYDLYHESLDKRMKTAGLNLTITKPETMPGEFSSYDWILAYQCPLPLFGSQYEQDPDHMPEGPALETNLFTIKGAPSENRMMPFPREPQYLTELETRFLQLRETVHKQEENKHFINLAKIQQDLRLNLLSIEQKQKELEQLISRAQAMSEGYYHVLGYYMREAIDRVLQLVTLGDVMKKYTKVLMIDNMGKYSIDQLEARGFRKRFITTMSQTTFFQTFREFKSLYQEQFPEKEASLVDFFSQCSVFDEHEIVFYNAWKTEKEGLPIQFRLRKAADLTRKEIRKLEEDPEKTSHKIDKLIEERRKLDLQLENTEYELQASETRGGLSESSYVALNKKRKRILRNIQVNSVMLTEINKEVDDRPDLTFLTRDFLATLKDRVTIRQIKAQKYLKDRDHINLNPDELLTMIGLMKQKSAKELLVKRLNTRVKLMLDKMQEYADLNPLDPEKNYQQVLGIHTLNNLEKTVLGCSLANLNRLVNEYRGPYFQGHKGQPAINWNDDRLSQVSFYFASKHITISTVQLQKFFRISVGDIPRRIEKSPALPRTLEFNNEKIDLFILNYDSYPYQDIVDCLKMRHRSKRPFVPVLILDRTNRLTTGNQKMVLDLLMGIKKDVAGHFSLATPSYRLDSLDDPDSLSTVLCEMMGVDENSVPSLTVLRGSKAEEDDFQFDLESGNLPDQPQSTKTPQKSEPPTQEVPGFKKNKMAPVLRSKSASIKLSPIEEKPEEIYTLGSLFSFDDEIPARDLKNDMPMDVPGDGNPETKSGIPDGPAENPETSVDPDESGNPEKVTREQIKSPEMEAIKDPKHFIF